MRPMWLTENAARCAGLLFLWSFLVWLACHAWTVHWALGAGFTGFMLWFASELIADRRKYGAW